MTHATKNPTLISKQIYFPGNFLGFSVINTENFHSPFSESTMNQGVGDFLKSPITKVLGFALIAFAFFYLGQHWSQKYQHLVFYNNNQQQPTDDKSIASSPNANATIPSLDSTAAPPPSLDSTAAPPLLPPKPPPAVAENYGIVDENGVMSEEFEVGDFDAGEEYKKLNMSVVKPEDVRVKKIDKFSFCSEDFREYIPCLDNVEEINKLDSTEKGEKYERHCPQKGDRRLNCLVPPPRGYKTPIPWPKSRDTVWFSNVPRTRSVDDKGGHDWIERDDDKFKFPGGGSGTRFIHGADQYLNQISQMVHGIAFGKHTRVVLDVGCGVASFGAFLLSRNVAALSVAPKDAHENQVQFALERGVPAMVAVLATRRLLYPSQAFELIHCSRCGINWTRDNGVYLLEINRMLRGGGYFAWAAQPVYKHKFLLQEQWKEMEDLTTRLCWELVKKEGYVTIWRKPSNNICYLGRDAGAQPPLCDPSDDPDNVWYVGLKSCITRLPENGYGTNITTWPNRLYSIPDRLYSIRLEFQISRGELFKAENEYWKKMLITYLRSYRWEGKPFRNVMDMRAGFGGFAAALIHLRMNCWIMNVVPVSAPNTLPVIYDRGLIGVMHDWCEPFDTYPRTYDLLNANRVFSTEQKRCNISTIMLEMDRILRPGGIAYILDSVFLMVEIQAVGKAMGWQTNLRGTMDGPHANWKLLLCEKSPLYKKKKRSRQHA